MTVRALRTRRRPRPAALRLTERDLDLLTALGRCRFLTTRQLAELAFWGSREAARKRLRRLFDQGLVRAWVPDGNLGRENVYSLDRPGARLLGEPPEGRDWPVPRGLDRELEHLLAANGIRIALALGLPEAGGELVYWLADWELKVRFRERVVPDGLFAVRWPEGERAYALEIDNRSRSPRRFLAKILRYRAALARSRGLYGFEALPVLVVGRDAEYLERYRRALARTQLGARVWFAALAEVLREGASGPIWRSAEGRCLSLRTLPNGREGSSIVSS